MANVKNLKIGSNNYSIQDSKALQTLTAADRSTLLSTGKYRGADVASGTDFMNADQKVEQYNFSMVSTVSNVAHKNPQSGNLTAGSTAGANGIYVTGGRSSSSEYNSFYVTTDTYNTWTKHTFSEFETTFDPLVAYVNDIFVVSDRSYNHYRKSTDHGTTWTEFIPNTKFNTNQLKYINGHYFAIASSQVCTSTDLINWTTLHSASYLNCANGYLFSWIVQNYSLTSKYTTDGVNWTNFTTPPNYNISFIGKAGGAFVCAYNSKYYFSQDLTNWTQSTPAKYGGRDGIVGGKFFSFNGSSYPAYYTEDGTTWSATNENMKGQNVGYADDLIISTDWTNPYIQIATVGIQKITSLTPKTYNKTEVDGLVNNVLKNTAQTSGSLAVGGSTGSMINATSVGLSSVANGWGSTAVGNGAQVTGSGAGTALGWNAVVSTTNAIQIGSGENSTNYTLQVGSHTLLDTQTGIVPVERLGGSASSTNNKFLKEDGTWSEAGGSASYDSSTKTITL